MTEGRNGYPGITVGAETLEEQEAQGGLPGKAAGRLSGKNGGSWVGRGHSCRAPVGCQAVEKELEREVVQAPRHP